MIQIHYKTSKNQSIIEFVCSGHAEYDVYGKDIVCSAVSSIIIGGFNALNNIENFDIKIEKGYVSLKALKENSFEDDIVLKTIIIQLTTIQKEYKKYIQIKKD